MENHTKKVVLLKS